MRSRTFIVLSRLGIAAAFLIVWQLASGRLVQDLFVSNPVDVASRFIGWIADGSLLFHASITAGEAITGFVIGGGVGVACGVILGRNPTAAEVAQPFIMAIYSLPKVALAPLFILWIGVGFDMKVTLVSVTVFFLVFVNTFTGVREVSRELISILLLMRARERDILLKVVLPSAFTWVFAGLRISVPYALIGAIVGELMASNRGLGYVLTSSASQFDTAGIFAALIAIIILANIISVCVGLLERIAMPWRKPSATGMSV